MVYVIAGWTHHAVDVHGQFACLLVDGEFDLWHGSYTD
jgi:hypothetical protein